jgi:hypothetical protein
MSLTAPDHSIFLRLAGTANDLLERHFWRWAGLLVTLFLACLIARGAPVRWAVGRWTPNCEPGSLVPR